MQWPGTRANPNRLQTAQVKKINESQFIDERTTHMSLALVLLVALVLGEAEPPLNLLRRVAHLGQSLRAPVGKCNLND